jgi:hypothetical protein
MRRVYFILSTAILCAFSVEAQVAIGSAEPKRGTILDLNPDGKPNHSRGGLLLSSVRLEKLTHIPGGNEFAGIANEQDVNSDLTGMVVWNTNDTKADFPDGVGLYAWDGNDWICISGGNGSSSGGGNSGGGGNVATVPIGRVAFRDSDDSSKPITGWYDFMTYNLGATNMTIDEQRAFNSESAVVKNGGASNTGYNSANATNYTSVYGGLYQWGRRSDGHENIWSTVSKGQVANANYQTSGNNMFMVNSIVTGDWIEGASNTNRRNGRWGGHPGAQNNDPISKGDNDPCPDDFRVPSIGEWEGILKGSISNITISLFSIQTGGPYEGVNKWVYIEAESGGTAGWLVYPPTIDANNKVTGYQKIPTLFLPAAGFRTGADENKNWSLYSKQYGLGSLHMVGKGQQGRGYYWSSTVYNQVGDFSYTLFFSGNISVHSLFAPRALGFSVRCIKYKNLSTP